jgi:inhibitor of KinA sporulation pathway (predicted exonuclease)
MFADNARPPYFLVVDLEATCSDDRIAVPRDEMEIIEIGAVIVDSTTFESLSEFQSFVRPVRNPALTGFCRELTGITQSEVDAASGYKDVLSEFVEWFSSYQDCLFCSWGDYDRRQFERDSEYHGVVYPFAARHLNLKDAYARKRGLRRGRGLSGVLEAEGIRFEGRPHRGIDDARNIAKLLPLIVDESGS